MKKRNEGYALHPCPDCGFSCAVVCSVSDGKKLKYVEIYCQNCGRIFKKKGEKKGRADAEWTDAGCEASYNIQ